MQSDALEFGEIPNLRVECLDLTPFGEATRGIDAGVIRRLQM